MIVGSLRLSVYWVSKVAHLSRSVAARLWKAPAKRLLTMTRWFPAIRRPIVWGYMWGLSTSFTFTLCLGFPRLYITLSLISLSCGLRMKPKCSTCARSLLKMEHWSCSKKMSVDRWGPEKNCQSCLFRGKMWHTRCCAFFRSIHIILQLILTKVDDCDSDFSVT